MKYHNPSDDQLDAAFAEHVAGMEKNDEGLFLINRDKDGNTFWGGPGCLSFTRSFDAVLPLLSKLCPHGWVIEENQFGGNRMFGCTIANEPSWTGWTECSKWSFADTAAKAACIALLGANGHEVTFDSTTNT